MRPYIYNIEIKDKEIYEFEILKKYLKGTELPFIDRPELNLRQMP